MKKAIKFCILEVLANEDGFCYEEDIVKLYHFATLYEVVQKKTASDLEVKEYNYILSQVKDICYYNFNEDMKEYIEIMDEMLESFENIIGY